MTRPAFITMADPVKLEGDLRLSVLIGTNRDELPKVRISMNLGGFLTVAFQYQDADLCFKQVAYGAWTDSGPDSFGGLRARVSMRLSGIFYGSSDLVVLEMLRVIDEAIGVLTARVEAIQAVLPTTGD